MSRRAWVLFIGISLLWGLPYLLIKVAVTELDPSIVVFVRVAVAALTLLPLAIKTGALKRIRKRIGAIVALSIIEVVAPFLLIAFGEQHITSSLAGLLIAADPLFIALLAVRFDHAERANGVRLFGLCLGFVGVVVLLGLNPGGDALGLLGGTFVLLAAFLYACGALVIKRVSDVPLLGSVTVSLGIAAIMLAPFALGSMPRQLPSPEVTLSLLALAVACTALGFVVYFSLIAEAGATRAALITYVNPAVAVVLGATVLYEPVGPATISGFGLIVVGCWLSTRSSTARHVIRSQTTRTTHDQSASPEAAQ